MIGIGVFRFNSKVLIIISIFKSVSESFQTIITESGIFIIFEYIFID